jgi:hypothetical protein
MSRLLWTMVAIVAGGIALYVMIRVMLGRWQRIHRLRLEREKASNRCPCGYDLEGLEIPRCPECGRAIGFDKSFDELGLTADEIDRLTQIRRARQQTDAD